MSGNAAEIQEYMRKQREEALSKMKSANEQKKPVSAKGLKNPLIRESDNNENDDILDVTEPTSQKQQLTSKQSTNKHYKSVNNLGYAPGFKNNDNAELTEEDEAFNDLSVDIGYKKIPLLNLPSRGIFYPTDMLLTIRACRVEEIRHYSTIDETDYIDMMDKFNFILDKCVKISTNRGILSYKALKEVDKFYVLFAIRELTFLKGENKLIMDIPCNSCGKTNKTEIFKDNFTQFNYPKELEKYFDDSLNAFNIKTTVGDIVISIPSIGVINFIKSYISDKIKKKEPYDKSFIKLAPFLFTDYRTLNRSSYEDMLFESYSWNIQKLSVVSGIVEELDKNIYAAINYRCSCGAPEVSVPLSFQRGIKSLFIISDWVSQLL